MRFLLLCMVLFLVYLNCIFVVIFCFFWLIIFCYCLKNLCFLWCVYVETFVIRFSWSRFIVVCWNLCLLLLCVLFFCLVWCFICIFCVFGMCWFSFCCCCSVVLVGYFWSWKLKIFCLVLCVSILVWWLVESVCGILEGFGVWFVCVCGVSGCCGCGVCVDVCVEKWGLDCFGNLDEARGGEARRDDAIECVMCDVGIVCVVWNIVGIKKYGWVWLRVCGDVCEVMRRGRRFFDASMRVFVICERSGGDVCLGWCNGWDWSCFVWDDCLCIYLWGSFVKFWRRSFGGFISSIRILGSRCRGR